jgi:hypothetical protein
VLAFVAALGVVPLARWIRSKWLTRRNPRRQQPQQQHQYQGLVEPIERNSGSGHTDLATVVAMATEGDNDMVLNDLAAVSTKRNGVVHTTL